jgi:DNA-binding transcriptional LysR family regulator
VFTVATMQAKIDAQLRGLGGGGLPLCMVGHYIDAGRLVVKKTERGLRQVSISYAWRGGKASTQGRALQWWLAQLESATTRAALLEQHRSI